MSDHAFDDGPDPVQPPPDIQRLWLLWHGPACLRHHLARPDRPVPIPPPQLLEWAIQHSPDHVQLIALYLGADTPASVSALPEPTPQRSSRPVTHLTIARPTDGDGDTPSRTRSRFSTVS